MSEISLNASMRSNLLSLQQISKLQDQTQLRLSTGLKVNSAIDNPSSYYTAQSLNNRADDLSALLDSMGQGIQTIKAATEGIDYGISLLNQAKAVVNQAMENYNQIVAKVATEEELFAAIDSGRQGMIVVTADIENISQTIKLKNGQSLVGASYFDGNASAPTLSFDFDDTTEQNGIEVKDGALVASLNIDYASTYDKNTFVAAIYANGAQDVKVQDVNLNITSKSNTVGFYGVFGIMGIHNAQISVSGNNQINLTGFRSIGIFAHYGSLIDISGQTDLVNDDQAGWGIWSHTQSVIDINSDAVLNYQSVDAVLILNSNAVSNVHCGASLSIINDNSASICSGLLNEYLKEGCGLSIEQGVNISVKYDAAGIDFGGIFTQGMLMNQKGQTLGDPTNYPGIITQTGSFQTYTTSQKTDSKPKYPETTAEKQYTSILKQYDKLVDDSIYKGINLLKDDKLKVNFNEDRTAKIEVEGVNVDSESLGLLTISLDSGLTIEKSITELEDAIKTLRSAASKLGNYYSIITERQTFTENLINVLQEGADKLTLADMNEESANMLSLQTQQSLAINSLSLASQAAQGVLRLF